ncbi:hypothetical protein H4R18_001406 [Coemansia javaensis]|uniref:Vacuolar ATPase assembly protein VMA22 n=1 Tax=Coemansia javaensis TaxID=2761396 RepID=A0A9W8HCX6_9FUNG|nr:hypothetical protein H4R18_001406 [Coemansia javaensis]
MAETRTDSTTTTTPEPQHDQRCGEADSELLAALEVLGEYRAAREASSAALRQGFFDLAVARRSAGYRQISAGMCSGSARAGATVRVNEAAGTIGPVRRAADGGSGSSGDPLLWFGGALGTPPALREAQRRFADALDQLAGLAQLTRRLAHRQAAARQAIAVARASAHRPDEQAQ